LIDDCNVLWVAHVLIVGLASMSIVLIRTANRQSAAQIDLKGLKLPPLQARTKKQYEKGTLNTANKPATT